MSDPVMHEIHQEADTNIFAALDSPQEDVVEVDGNADNNADGSTEVKPEQIETSAVEQTQQEVDDSLQLRQLLRSQKMELELLKSTVSRHEAVQNSEVGDDIPLSDVEQLQNDIAELGESRSSEISLLLETMELNPKYEDVKAVCSRNNFDDILDLAATDVAAKAGISETAAMLLLEKEVWSQPNPYKYMYDLIKGYHPKYTVVDVKPATAGRVVAANAPVSVSGLGGDADITSGWSSSKIDAMAESDLGKVPPDIYEKYLQGTLA